ncbi:hypothetical protein [Marivirga lumbricoides]
MLKTLPPTNCYLILNGATMEFVIAGGTIAIAILIVRTVMKRVFKD